jgi:DNA polymerase-4
MNSYFASVEQQKNPALRGKPVGVGGKPGTRSVIAAASREAKTRGVKTAMSSWDAIRICPELIIVPPDYETYQAWSERMFGILETLSPTVEIFSIDEAFVELHGIPDGQAGIEAILSAVFRIKAMLKKHLGEVMTASIGVAHGKRLAKLAGEWQKPDGCVVLLGDDEGETVKQFERAGVLSFRRDDLYQQTPIEELCGIGPRLTRRLHAASIFTLAELARLTLDELRTMVFPYEKELYFIGKGSDPSPVIPYWATKPEQSIGHQYTLPSDVPVVDLPPVLSYLAEKVGHRMRRQGFVAHGVAVYLRKSDRSGWGDHSHTSQQLEGDRDIYSSVWKLIEQAINTPGSGLGAGTFIRMPSITVNRLVRRTQTFQPLLIQEQRSLQITRAMDSIRDRFGARSIASGLSLGTSLHSVPDGRRKRFTPQLLEN